MLNYIWVALILLGVSAALTTDIINNSNDKYRNNVPFPVILSFTDHQKELKDGDQNVNIRTSAEEFNKFYSTNIKSNVILSANLNYKKETSTGFISITGSKNLPSIWNEMSEASGEKNNLSGTIRIGEQISSTSFEAKIVFEKVSFLKMKDVTNAVIDYAGTAVTIA
ncbi:MAG: hypothetical protein P8X47_02285, partial [Ignavibacteriaceae bacterium]